MAFKLLSKNSTIPANVQQHLFPSQAAKRAPSTSEAIAAANQTLSQVTSTAAGSAQTNGTSLSSETTRSEKGFETFTSPYSLLKKTISYTDHGSRRERIMVPSVMPTGVDIDRVREERERIVYNRIMARKA